MLLFKSFTVELFLEEPYRLFAFIDHASQKFLIMALLDVYRIFTFL